MKKFVCLHCGANEYSSYDNGKPCQRCMGKMVEVPSFATRAEAEEALKEEQHE